MDENIKVSVLMLTYNHEKYIDEAIKSVLMQVTNFPFELIIGDDSSTDQTGTICQAWQKKNPDKIILFKQKKNVGLQENFISCYNQCQGTYIAICEGDDFWIDKHKLQKQIDFLDTHPEYSTCFHRVINYYQANGSKSLSNGIQKRHTTIYDLAASNYISNVSAVFRHRLFGPLPEWFKTVSTYDYAIHMLNAQYGDIYYFSKPMAVYRQHGNAIWSTARTDRKLKIALQVRELLIEYFQQREDVLEPLVKAYTNISFNLLDYYYTTNDANGIVETKRQILHFHPTWTTKMLDAVYSNRSLTIGKKVRKSIWMILKRVRGVISQMIPLPRI